MKKRLLVTLSVLMFVLAVCWLMGQSDWHLDRNTHNASPLGPLKQQEGRPTMFTDSTGRIWELLPARMNKFHQPARPVARPATPYPGLLGEVEFDPANPNLKFLSREPGGGSSEAILKPDGNYLTTGPQRATYNYGHPDGVWGIIKHTVWDVLPHFMNGQYRI